MGQVVGHKTDLNKLKNTEIIQKLLSDIQWDEIRIKRQKLGNSTRNMWKLRNMNNQWVKEQTEREILKSIS